MSEGAVVAVSIVVMNVATYGLTVAAARLMGPSGFGQFSAVMAILMVLNVLALGLQATGARRVAVAGDRTRVESEIRRAAGRGALALVALTLISAPVLKAVLDLESWVSLLGLAATAGVLTVVGGLAGLLQGEGRWWPLAAVFVTIGVGRFACGVLALWVSSSTASAMVGVAAGTAVPLAVAAAALSHRRPSAPPPDGYVDTTPADGLAPATVAAPGGSADGTAGTDGTGGDGGNGRGVLAEVAHSTHALLAFFVLSTIDIVIARAVLPDHDAGLFAGGLIITKAVTFLPQFVIVLAFPVMARRGSSDRAHVIGLSLVATIGLAATLGVAAIPALAQLFIGGEPYAEVTGTLWLYALAGTVLASIQFLVYSSLALEHPRAVYVLWGGVALFAVVALTTDTPTGLIIDRVWTALLTAVVLVVLLTRPRSPGVSERRRASSGRHPR